MRTAGMSVTAEFGFTFCTHGYQYGIYRVICSSIARAIVSRSLKLAEI